MTMGLTRNYIRTLIERLVTCAERSTLIYKVILHVFFFYRRFTTAFAEKARKVVAVDFMENFIQKNKEATATYRNVEHRCTDVTKLKLDEQK